MPDSSSVDRSDQTEMMHRAPDARVVDRVDHLVEVARNKHAIHVGFVDAGFEAMARDNHAWLHARLHRVAKRLVGLDVAADGVERAVAEGYEAVTVDCSDTAAIAAAGIEPADVVIGGELIEHLGNPEGFLEAAHSLVAPDGRLVLTTPNGTGMMNGLAAVVGREINHPDHVIVFTQRTLTALLERTGWVADEWATYVPSIKTSPSADGISRPLRLAAGVLLGTERAVTRFAPFVADGLIVSARRA